MVESAGDADFGVRLHEQVFELWIEPELVRRGGKSTNLQSPWPTFRK